MDYVHAVISKDIGQIFTLRKKITKKSEYGDTEYKPLLVFSGSTPSSSHQTSLHAVAVEYQAEIPSSFIDHDGNNVNVLGIWQQQEEHYPCPRDRTDDNVLVMTNRGSFLFCYDCRNFYTEGGRWGYKTSWAAFEQMKADASTIPEI